jgi:flagellar biogenesis protein FliO
MASPQALAALAALPSSVVLIAALLLPILLALVVKKLMSQRVPSIVVEPISGKRLRAVLSCRFNL